MDDPHLQGRLVGFLAPDMGTPTCGLYSALSDLEPVLVSLNTENDVDIIICSDFYVFFTFINQMHRRRTDGMGTGLYPFHFFWQR